LGFINLKVWEKEGEGQRINQKGEEREREKNGGGEEKNRQADRNNPWDRGKELKRERGHKKEIEEGKENRQT
jgi:hypothetical protein